MHPILFQIGSIHIYSFGLMLALGILLAGTLIFLLAHRFSLSTKGLFDSLLFIIFLSVVGARVAYVATYPQYFHAPLGNFMQVFALWEGGLIFYGAVIGGVIGAFLFARNDKRNLWRWLNILFLGTLLGVVFGQIGCYLGSCAVGVTTHLTLAPDHRVPTQIFESLWAAILFVIGLAVVVKQPKLQGDRRFVVFGTVAYFLGRLVIDIWRSTTVTLHGYSTLLIGDIIIIVIALIWLVLTLLKHRKRKKA